MELEFERLKSQALNHRALNLIKRWRGVGAVIQQRKVGETWPEMDRREQGLQVQETVRERTKPAYALLVVFPNSKQQGMRSWKGASKDWRQGFLEEVGLEKWVELKEMGSAHSRQSTEHQQRP